MNVLLTGSTGSVGTALVEQISADHSVYCLVRNVRGRTDLSVHSVNLEGDVCLPNCGLSELDINSLKAVGFDAFVHNAASVSFEEKEREQIFKTNLDGTVNALALAKRLGVSTFQFVSTAYVTGETRRNCYEESKVAAEDRVRGSGLPFNIFRPSICVGDSRTYEIKNYDSFYAFSKAVHMIAQGIRKRLNMTADAKVHLPLYLECTDQASANLVPVDWVASSITGLLPRTPYNREILLAHPNPMKFRDACRAGLDAMHIEGVQLVDDKSQVVGMVPELARVQRRMDQSVAVFKPYVTQSIPMDVRKSHASINSRLLDALPTIDTTFVQNLLSHAVEQNFGRAIR